MSDVEYIANMAEIISGLTVIIGIGFGFVEYRRHKSNERREAVASLARSFQTKEFAAAIRVVLELPGPIDSEQYNSLSRRDKNLLWMLLCSMESIGILVYRGDLTLSLADEFFSVPLVEGWKRLYPYVEELRRELDGPQAWEWYQWLAEQIAESHRHSPRVPAHIAHQT
jgi:hypothetical protein